MSNPLYWEDHVSSSGGRETPMIVDTHAPSFSVQWGKGKYDDVDANHQNLMGQVTSRSWCFVCDTLTVVNIDMVCVHCQRAQNAEERRRIAADKPMGGNKRGMPFHITRDGRVTGQMKSPPH